ncbi:MAG: FHA domain-containing protein [Breznakibacter sp.]
MNNTWTIIVSAATGGIVTLITTYVSSIISFRKERKKWESETALKFIDYSLSNPILAKKVARQFSIAFIVHLNNEDRTESKYFLPAFCRFSVGRNEDNDICVNDQSLSRDHGLFYYKNGRILYKDTYPTNKTWINGKVITKKHQLKSGDILKLGVTRLRYEEL